jgi:adenosylcobinamide kinase/adenosylcobinamide-phosphate guanylyltransferase
MAENRVILVGGGVRSGKSAFAVGLGERLGERRAFIATAQAFDDEMRARIQRHREERKDRFVALEEPRDLPARLASLSGFDVVVVDCLTLWITNLLLGEASNEQILAGVDALVEVLAARRLHVVLVTNEVGMSVHPETALGRRFQELCGWTHQRLAKVADAHFFAVMGSVIRVLPFQWNDVLEDLKR